MGERGGLGGGDNGLVIESAGCTATGDVGTVCAGTEPGHELGAEEPAAEVFEDRRMRKSLFATSLRRDMDSSSRALKSSWSFCSRATKRDLVLRGITLDDNAAAAVSEGSMCGNVMSGNPAEAGEPLGEAQGEAEGVAWGAGSKGSSLLSVARVTCLAAARRMELAASMSLGGGGRASHLLWNACHKR